jgi:hypothetical protein
VVLGGGDGGVCFCCPALCAQSNDQQNKHLTLPRHHQPTQTPPSTTKPKQTQETGLQEFIFGQPAQVALLGIQAMWTADTQAALTNARTDKGAMTRNMKKTDALLRCVVGVGFVL